MSTLLIRQITLLIAVGCLALTATAQELYHADFEKGDGDTPQGWVFRAARGTCTGRWDSEHAASGNRSLRLAILNDQDARAHWALQTKIPVEPETNYEFAMMAMGYGITGEAYAICYENGKGTPDSWHHTRKLKGTSGWEAHTIRFTTRPDAEFLSVVFKLRHGLGYAWFDDITLSKSTLLPEPGRTSRVFPEDDGFSLQAMWSPAQWTAENELHLIQGHTNSLSLFFRGKAQNVSSPALLLDLPEGLRPVGPVFRGRGPMPTDQPATATESAGREQTQRWHIPIPAEPLKIGLKQNFSWETYHHIALQVTAEAPARGTFRWRLANGGKPGPDHDIPFEIHPNWDPPELCESFQIYIQHTGGIRHPNTDVRTRIADYLKLAGIQGGLGLSYYEPKLIDADVGLQGLGWEMHTWRFDGYGGSVPEAPLIDQNGKTVAGRVCPSAQLEHAEPWYGSLQNYYRTKLTPGLQRLIIDYEPPTRNVCFCKTCRLNFARANGLPEDTIGQLPGDALLAQHAEQWGTFRAKQNGDLIELHCRLIRQTSPECSVGICSWPGTENVAKQGGDIRLFERAANFHAPMIYTKDLAYHRVVNATCQRTRKPVLPFIELSDISQPRHLTPDELRMNLLATAGSGGRGAFLWVGMECLDALYLRETRVALDIIRELRHTVPLTRTQPAWITTEQSLPPQQQILIDGEKRPLPDALEHPYLRSHVWGTETQAAFLCLNYDPGNNHSLVVTTKMTDVIVSLQPYLFNNSTDAQPALEKVGAREWRLTVAPYSHAAVVIKRK